MTNEKKKTQPRTFDLGFDPVAVKKELERYGWEAQAGVRSRRIFLGTVGRLFPSGKLHDAFASNLTLCPTCDGTQTVHPLGLRRETKNLTRTRRKATRWTARFGAWDAWPPHARKRLVTLQRRAWGTPCPHCEGFGSLELRDDAAYADQAAHALLAVGCLFEQGEDDPYDCFAVQFEDLGTAHDSMLEALDVHA